MNNIVLPRALFIAVVLFSGIPVSVYGMPSIEYNWCDQHYSIWGHDRYEILGVHEDQLPEKIPHGGTCRIDLSKQELQDFFFIPVHHEIVPLEECRNGKTHQVTIKPTFRDIGGTWNLDDHPKILFVAAWMQRNRSDGKWYSSEISFKPLYWKNRTMLLNLFFEVDTQFPKKGIPVIGVLYEGQFLPVKQEDRRFIAVKTGDQPALEAFIERDRKSISDLEDVNGNTLVHLAAATGRLELMDLILNKKGSLNEDNKDGQSALMLAVGRGDEEMVALLKSKKAKLKTKDLFDRNVFHYAARAGNSEILELLLVKADRDLLAKRDKFGYPPVLIALQEGHDEVFQKLLAFDKKWLAGKSKYWTLPEAGSLHQTLYECVDRETPSIIRYLLETGADPTCICKGSSALHRAAAVGSEQVIGMVYAHCPDINYQDRDGYTPMARASANANVDTVRFLLRFGANHDIPDYYGCYPIHHAIYAGSLEIVEMFLAEGVNPALKTNDETAQSTVKLAIMGGHEEILSLLLERGASPDIPYRRAVELFEYAIINDLPEAIPILERSGINHNFAIDGVYTALWLAEFYRARKILSVFEESLSVEQLNKLKSIGPEVIDYTEIDKPVLPLSMADVVYSGDKSTMKGDYLAEIEVLLNTSGDVVASRIIDNAVPGLDKKILQTARRWTFTQAFKDGYPVFARHRVHFLVKDEDAFQKPVPYKNSNRFPKKIFLERPSFPRVAGWAGQSGELKLGFVISHEGMVTEVLPLEIEGADFMNALLVAMRKWRFERPLIRDKPVNLMIQYTFNFRQTTIYVPVDSF